MQPTVYTASSTVFVGIPNIENGMPATSAAQARSSYADVATTPLVLETVIARLHLHLSATALARRITTSAPSGTVTFDVIASDGSATRSAAIANSVATELVDAASKLSPADTHPAPHLAVVRRAVVPTSPTRAAVWMDAAWGALIGGGLVLLGIAVAVLRKTSPPTGGAAPSMSL